MLDKFLFLFHDLPRELIVIFVSTLPIFELRGAIPLGFAFHFPWYKVFLLAVLGNLIPIPFILILLEPVSGRLRRFRIWRKFFDWLFERARKKAREVERYEFWGLSIFVGIPLPMTGAWTGAIIASLIKMRFRKAFLSIALGVLMAAVVVTLLVLMGRLIISLPASKA
ncbi:MAG: small multi-drug export protein [Candidatus Omnitrophica bacterium]|nr:small multi-drug export protein [Candidatus Omnitrophota bacterium]